MFCTYGVVESWLLGNRAKELQKSPRTLEMFWFMSRVVLIQQEIFHRKAFLQKTINTSLQLPRACYICWKTMTVLLVFGIYSSLVINISVWYFNLLSSKLTENHKPQLQGILIPWWRVKKDRVSEKCHWGPPSPSCQVIVTMFLYTATQLKTQLSF